MNTLIINTSDILGGAAKAAYRLHIGLLGAEIDTQMLVQKKISDEHTIIGPSGSYDKFISLFRPDFDSALRKILSRSSSQAEFSINLFPLTSVLSSINKVSPELVHLHWVNGGMIRIEEVSKIIQPLVWTLHDMWAFTGGCHYSSGCENYKTHCHSCPEISQPGPKDISYKTFQRKLKAWKNKKIIFVTPSSWLAECAKQSKLLHNQTIEVIHNGIDLDRYRPSDSQQARHIWGLPKKKKLLLFGAMNATSDFRKGFDLLHDAINHLHERATDSIPIEIVIYGASKPANPPYFKYPIHYLGQINDDISLSLLYSAVDVMIVPSREDNLPNTVVESIACGTPVVAFNIGGMPDMIQHLKNGYLASPYDSADLANGIHFVIENNDGRMSDQARKIAEKLFDIKHITQKYINLYQRLLEEQKRDSKYL